MAERSKAQPSGPADNGIGVATAANGYSSLLADDIEHGPAGMPVYHERQLNRTDRAAHSLQEGL